MMGNWKVFIVVWMLLCLPCAVLSCSAPVPPDTGKIDVTGVAAEVSPPEGLILQIWRENNPFYQKILALPYNQELASGKLDDAVFRDFIIQDYHFLQNYKKVHGILLSKAPDEDASRFMVKMIKLIDDEIASLHAGYIKKYNITSRELTDPTDYPSTELYNDFLVKTATLEPFEVGLMATMPCHMVYYQIGIDMKQIEKVPDNKYQAWIDNYGKTAWENSLTKEIVDFAERYMHATTDENRQKMKNSFVTAMKLEYMFWDGIYNRVKWVE